MRYRVLIASLIMMNTVTAAPAAAAAAATWPPRDYLVQNIVREVEPTLKTQDPETGRFGSKPWIVGDQNVIWPLAVAWATEHDDNPWYHDARLLEAVMAGGDALVDDQDATGKWIFRKKDDSTWGMIHMPWTYSRWLRAYSLIRDAMPPERRAKWEQGLRLGFEHIRGYMNGGIHNIPTHHAMALYLAGELFGEPEWQEAASGFMARVVEEQDPTGYWSENFGPVVGYNAVYVEALGIYYALSHDPVALEALQRAARFHSSVLWPDGSEVATIDERQIYHDRVDVGNVGFSWTPEGRGWLAKQVGWYIDGGRVVNADYCATMLVYGGEGEAIAPAASGDAGRVVLGDGDAVIERHKPWAVAMSAYAAPPVKSRWIQDRHNLVDIYHDDLGLVVGGGNTKLQPYWSTFTVGDPALLQHTPGDESPNFTPAIDLLWAPTSADLTLGEVPALRASYGEVTGVVTPTPQADGSLAVTYAAENVGGRRVEAHVPLLYRSATIQTADGRLITLSEDDVVLAADELGEHFNYGGLQVTVPPGAELRWPAKQHNPYAKDGRSGASAWKLALVVPLTAEQPAQTVTLRPVTVGEQWDTVWETRELPFTSPSGTRTKVLDDLGSVFLAGREPGDSLAFTLPAIAPGTYELGLQFVKAYSYGIVQVNVDGEPVGEPFDGYAPLVDSRVPPVTIGRVTLGPGEHTLSVELVDRSEPATASLISVQKVLLRRMD